MNATAPVRVALDARHRVLVVDDSAFMRMLISEVVSSSGEFLVVGTARDGADAVAQVRALDPDVVTLDVHMPEVDGIAALRQIMCESPRAVVMLSAEGGDADAEVSARALALGAVDFVRKPSGPISLDLDGIHDRLLGALRVAAHRRTDHARGRHNDGSAILASGTTVSRAAAASLDEWRDEPRRVHPATALVCIAASTGGPAALSRVLPRLPRYANAAVLVVQHMPTGYTAHLAARLHAVSRLTVSEASDGDVIQAGHVYVAPGGYHLRAARGAAHHTLRLDRGPRLNGVRPAADHLFCSAAEVYGAAVVGVVLTGMGRDGADGLRAIRLAGGFGAVEDGASAVVRGMPEAALLIAGADRIVPLDGIADAIGELVARMDVAI